MEKNPTCQSPSRPLLLLKAPAKQTDSATADAKDDEQVESATDASADATLLKAAAAASAKGKGKVATTSTEAKAADAKLAAADAAKVPAAHGAATNQEQPEEKSGSKHESSSAATGDSKDAVQSAAAKKSAESTFDAILAKLTPTDADASKPAVTTPAASTPQVTVPAEQKFAADNTDNVVSSVRTQINASGNGQMRIRLDPPELGALDVAVKMVDGRMTASFTTNNDQATQLLSHSLGDLKNSLEANGISVDRIQVRQASAGDNAQQQPGSGEHRRENGNAFDQPSQRGDQQRKEAVQKMWRKLAYGSDELDFVA